MPRLFNKENLDYEDRRHIFNGHHTSFFLFAGDQLGAMNVHTENGKTSYLTHVFADAEDLWAYVHEQTARSKQRAIDFAAKQRAALVEKGDSRVTKAKPLEIDIDLSDFQL